MRRIDEVHLDRPFYGSRRMTFELNETGHGINRKHVQRLMRVMDCPPSALLRQFRGFRNGGFLDHRIHHGAQMRQKSGPEKRRKHRQSRS